MAFPGATALIYLLLSGVYLLYWPHVEYFVDDWILLQAGDLAGAANFAIQAAQNHIYEVFRMQWLSILWGFLITRLGGYSARFNFAALLVLHAANAWLLCQALWRFGLERRFAFLAGVFFLLGPTVHFVLFSYLTNPFFVFSTFWVLLLLWLASGPRPRPVALAMCAVAGMFSGEQPFLLLWLILPLAAWCRGRGRPWPRRQIAAVWAALAIALGSYLLWVNRLPVRQRGVDERYRWTSLTLRNNVSLIGEEFWRLSGLPSNGFYRLAPTLTDLALAGVAAVIVAGAVARWRESTSLRAADFRLGWWAVACATLAYAPTLFIAGGYPFRYHYVAAPFVAAGVVALCRRVAPLPAVAGLVAAFGTLNAAAEIRQCWIPQSGELRRLRTELQRLPGVVAGDILVVSGTRDEIGTAPHFVLHAPVVATAFAERTLGVRPLLVSVEVRKDHGGLAIDWNWRQYRPVTAAALSRTHVLVYTGDGRFQPAGWVAAEFEPGRFRLLPLAGTAPLANPEAVYTGEQLALVSDLVYFPKAPPGHE